MKKVLEEAVAKVSERATAVIVNVTDRAEKEIVKKFGLDRAPMPLALAIAPNGRHYGRLSQRGHGSSVSLAPLGLPSTEKCMKSLQDGKLVFLCVQNASTKSNTEALQGVQDFKAEAQYAGATEIVMLDPASSAEASFLGDLKIDPQTKVAVTAFLAPPGAVIAEFEGELRRISWSPLFKKPVRPVAPAGLVDRVAVVRADAIFHDVGRIGNLSRIHGRIANPSYAQSSVVGGAFKLSTVSRYGSRTSPKKTLVMEGR